MQIPWAHCARYMQPVRPLQAITLGAIGVAAAAEFYDRSTDKVQIMCALLEPVLAQCELACRLWRCPGMHHVLLHILKPSSYIQTECMYVCTARGPRGQKAERYGQG